MNVFYAMPHLRSGTCESQSAACKHLVFGICATVLDIQGRGFTEPMAVDDARGGEFEGLAGIASGPGPARCMCSGNSTILLLALNFRIGDHMQLTSAQFFPVRRQYAAIEGWIVILTNLHEEAQEDDVHETCAEYGDVKNLHLNLDRRTGFVKGYALVEYANKAEAEDAIEKLHGSTMLTRTIAADWAFMRGPRARRAASKQHS